jgi:HCOMODA/2-hydroxy-3-carboxy-muconic semialdehyde decarboxylase
MGILGKKPKVVHGFGSFLGEEVPIFSKPYLVVSSDLAAEVAEALGTAEALLMRGNGDVVTGRSVQEATVKAIFLEESCRIQYLALCAGTPTYFSSQEIAIRSEPGYDHWGRAWAYYEARLTS